MGLDVSAKWTSQLIHDILSITSKLHMYHWCGFLVQTSLSPYNAAQVICWDLLGKSTANIIRGVLPLSGYRCVCQPLSVLLSQGPRKNLCFRRSNYKSWSVTSFSHVLLWVLHLTKVYRILALGIGNMEIKESRQCSLGPQDFDATASTQWSLQWPWAPSLESAPGLSTIAPSQSRTVPLCAVLPAWRWVTQHTGLAVWRRMEWLHIR